MTANTSSGWILEHLVNEGAVLTNRHFIYTSGKHGTAYINMREVAHQSDWLSDIGRQLANVLASYKPELVIGPETLGRTLSDHTGSWLDSGKAIWCSMEEDPETHIKFASFSPKLGFERLVPGERIAIVDDLLTTGTSLLLVSDLVTAHGGIVVGGAVVVRRTPDVTAADCGVPELKVLAEVEGFEVFDEDECKRVGPCSRRVPVVLRPGHGHEWIKKPENVDYPVAS
jgi:orotate phosphoribosyltransferase